MNPSSSRIWNIPPPPGTEEEELSNCSSRRDGSTFSAGRGLERIDSYVKSSEYVEHEIRFSSERVRYRSRSKSRSREERHHRRRRSRSRSRDRHRRSRSRHRRRRRSGSRSRSHSPGYRHSRRRHGRRRGSTSRYSRSRSRSTSRGRSHRSHRTKSEKERSVPRNPHVKEEVPDADTNEVDMKIEEEEEEEEEVKDNLFKNDGSFLEMFKKMQEQQKSKEGVASAEEAKPVLPAINKRRGGKVLKTGLVQKVRIKSEEESNVQDAWSVYMKEVRRYKEACCDDDSKTRPLVK